MIRAYISSTKNLAPRIEQLAKVAEKESYKLLLILSQDSTQDYIIRALEELRAVKLEVSGRTLYIVEGARVELQTIEYYV